MIVSQAEAQIKESSEWIVGRREHGLLTRIHNALGFPDTELPNGQAVVAVLVEGPNLTVLAVGPVKGDAKAYAKAIESWRILNNYPANVEYSQEDDCAAAALVVKAGGFGKMEASIGVDIGDLTKSLSAIEPHTSIALVAPPYTNLDLNAKPDYKASTGNRYWNITRSGVSGMVTSTIKIPGWVIPALVAWVFLPIFGLGVCFAAGFTIAKDSRRPIAARRKIYSNLVVKGTYVTLGIHMVLVMATLPTRALDPVSQVWFGFRFSQIGIMIVPFFAILPLAALPWLNKMETKLLGPTEEEKAQKEDFSQYELPKSEGDKKADAARRRRTLYVTFAILGIGLILSLWPLPKSHPLAPFQRLVMPIVILANLVPTLMSTNRVKKDLEAIGAQPTNVGFQERVKSRAAALATTMNTRLPAIKIGPLLQGPYGAAITKTTLTVTPALADRFSDHELDFILAHELAHAKNGDLVRRRVALLVPIILVYVLFCVVLFGKSLSFAISPNFIFSPFLVILLLSYPYSRYFTNMMQKQEFAADEAAIRVTKDPDAAVSALAKITKQNSLPGFDEFDFQRSHPKVARRIERIRSVFG